MNTHFKIQLKLYATLKKFTPNDGDEINIEPGSSVDDILKQLGIPDTDAKLIFINGKKGAIDTILNGGERLGIFPPVGGG
jgi:molybdopterin synthase sulfur carrier subunit